MTKISSVTAYQSTASDLNVYEDNSTAIKTAVEGINSNVVACDTSALATSAKQLGDDHNVTVSNMIAAVETGLATSALQLADGHNVTVDNANGASAVHIQDGGNTITVDGTVTANLSAVDNTVLDNIKIDTEAIETAVEKMDDWDNAASDGASVTGDVAHSGVDAGEPVKVGGKAIDYQPNSEGEQGAAEVTANDRTNGAFNLRGEAVECVKGEYQLLTELDQNYDADPTTDISSAYECWQYREGSFSTTATETGAATDIIFDILFSNDNGSSYQKFDVGYWQDLRYTDTMIGTNGDIHIPFTIRATHIKIRVTCNGTGASNYFTLDNSAIYMRN